MRVNAATTKEAIAESDLLGINTALPGIGDAFSEKIIKGRPYKRKDELVQKKITPQATYDKIKDQIAGKREVMRHIRQESASLGLILCKAGSGENSSVHFFSGDADEFGTGSIG